MKHIKNQSGVSLVELIAALALVSMVAVLIMTTLSIGIKHSNIEGDKVRIQQEANLIVSKLLKQHREGVLYCIKIEGNDLYVSSTLKSPNGCIFEEKDIINNREFKISNLTNNEDEETIDPTKRDVDIAMELSYAPDTEKRSTYKIQTTLSRYKTN